MMREPTISQEKIDLAFKLIGDPRQPAMPHDEFLRRWPAEDGAVLASELIAQAVGREDGWLFTVAKLIGYHFGYTSEPIQLLNTAAMGIWHWRHEDIAMDLAGYRDPSSVECLRFLTRWVPDYALRDEFRNIAVKAIYALAKIDTPEAKAAIDDLMDTKDENILRGLYGIEVLEDPEDVAFVHELVNDDAQWAKDALEEYMERYRVAPEKLPPGIRRGISEIFG